MRIIDRFNTYMEAKGLTTNAVTAALSLSVGLLHKASGKDRDLSQKTINKILSYYTDLNPAWLLNGDGKMLLENPGNDSVDSSATTTMKLSTIEKLIDDINVNGRSIDKLVDEIAKSHELLGKSQEQLDRVLTLYEKEQNMLLELKNVLVDDVSKK